MYKKVKDTGRHKLVLVVMVVVASIFCLAGCGGKTINLNDYLNYSFEGYDSGYGYINSEFDYYSFEQDIQEKYSSKDAGDIESMMPIMESKIQGTWDRYDGLANGETVTFKWDIDTEFWKETFGIKAACSDVTTEVSGLTELGEFDTFEGMAISVSGMAGDGKLSFRSENYPNITFYASKTSQLAPGDEITISISEDVMATYAMTYGAIPTRTSMTYTVGPMDTMITKVEQIPTDLDENIRRQLDDFVVSMYADDEYKSLTSYDVLGYYVLSPKSHELKNQLYIVYRATIHGKKDGKEEDVDSYKYLKFTDAIVYKNGTGYVDLLNYDCPKYGWFDEEGFSTSLLDYAGYKSLDFLYNQCIASQLEMWVVDTDVVR